MATAGSVRAGAAFVEIYAKDTAFQQALERVQRKLQALGQSMQRLGTQMSMIGVALGVPMVLAARSAAKFEDALLGMQAAAGVSANDLKVVEKAALEMSREMGVAPSKIAQAFLELLKAGMSLQEVLDGAGKSAVEFARVSGVEMADAAVFMKVAMNTFGVSAEEAVDTLSAAADASETSIAAMVESFGLVGSAGALFNQSLFDISQGLAVMARYGIKGEEAGTGIKTMLMRLTSPAQEAEDALAQIGLSVESFRNIDGQLLPLVQIVGILDQALMGVDQVMRDRILGQVFGDRGIRVIGAFLDYGTAGFATMAEAMESNLPVSTKFAIIMSGITGAIEEMGAAVERLSISFAKSLGNGIANAANAVSKMLDIVGALIEAFPAVAQAVVGGTVALLALGATLIVTGVAFQTLATIVGVVAAVLSSPITIAVAAFTAGVAVILSNVYQLSPAFAEQVDAIMASMAVLDFTNAWKLMNINLAIALVEQQKQWHDTFSFVKNSVMSVSDWIGDKMIEGLDRFLGLFGSDILWLQGQLERLGLYFKAAFDWDFLINGLDAAIAKVDARIKKAREDLPTADAREAARDQNRADRDAGRKKADDEKKAGYDPTIAELQAERDRLMKAATAEREKRKLDQENKAKQPAPQIPMEGGGGGMGSKALGTFSSATAGRIGVGPELDLAARQAKAAEQAVELLGQINGKVGGQFMGDVNAAAGAAMANMAPNVPLAGIDDALVRPAEQTAASTADAARSLADLVRLARGNGGGLVFG